MHSSPTSHMPPCTAAPPLQRCAQQLQDARGLVPWAEGAHLPKVPAEVGGGPRGGELGLCWGVRRRQACWAPSTPRLHQPPEGAPLPEVPAEVGGGPRSMLRAASAGHTPCGTPAAHTPAPGRLQPHGQEAGSGAIVELGSWGCGQHALRGVSTASAAPWSTSRLWSGWAVGGWGVWAAGDTPCEASARRQPPRMVK